MASSYILDANILMSGMLSRKRIYTDIFEKDTFYTPDFALKELNKYKRIILDKAEFDRAELKEFTIMIFTGIIVVPDFIISDDALNKAIQLCSPIDLKDAVYIGLAIELDCTLLTRDKALHDGLKKMGFEKVMLFDQFVKKNSAYL